MVVTTLTWSQTHLQDTENLPCGCPGQSGRSAGFCQTSEGEEWPEPSNMLACAGSAPGGATGPPHPISSPLPGPRAGPGTPSSATGVTPHCRAGLGSQGNYGANSAWLVGPAGPASGGNGALLRASHWSVASAGLCGQFCAFIALGISHIPCAQAEDQPESLHAQWMPLEIPLRAVCYPHPMSLILVPKAGLSGPQRPEWNCVPQKY